jgi:hypothetical protein
MTLRIYLSLVALLLFLISGFIYLDGLKREEKFSTIKYQNGAYTYDNGVSDNTEVRSFNTKIKNLKEYENKSIKINFDLRVNEINFYENVFQTGPGNAGIRLELSKPGTLSLVYGMGNVRAIVITNKLDFDQWYNVGISINSNNHVTVNLNDSKVFDQEIKDFNYLISDFAIGTGFNKERNLNGEIKNFNVEIDFYRELSFIKYIDISKTLIYLLSVAIVYRLLYPRSLQRLRFSSGSAIEVNFHKGSV